MPDPVPVTLIGRLAIDERFKGIGRGESLLQDAALRAVRVSLEIGSADILVHTKDKSAMSPCRSERDLRQLRPGREQIVIAKKYAGESIKGATVTEELIANVVEPAERGYDIEQLRKRGRPSSTPMPRAKAQ